jgi:hypothetical protein
MKNKKNKSDYQRDVLFIMSSFNLRRLHKVITIHKATAAEGPGLGGSLPLFIFCFWFPWLGTKQQSAWADPTTGRGSRV